MTSDTVSQRLRRTAGRDEFALVGVLLLLSAVFWVLAPRSILPGTWFDLIREIAPNLVAALGVAILMIGRAFDVSVGSMLALSGVIMIETVNLTGSTTAGAFAALGIGLAVGAFHGLLVTRFHLNSLMTTLGSLFLLRGIVYVWTGLVTVSPQEPLGWFEELYHGEVLGIPIPGVVVVVLYVVAGWVMHQTPVGRAMYAAGGNEEAARASGIDVRRLRFWGFVLSGVLAAFAGLILTAQTGSGYFNAGQGFEFIVIAAVVVGGISLDGGRGTIYGAALGVVIIGFTGKSLRLTGAHTTWQLVATGGLMMLALWLYGLRERWATWRASRAPSSGLRPAPER